MIPADAIIGVDATLVGIAYALVAVRLVVPRQKTNRHLIMSNLWLLLTGLNLAGLEACNVILYYMGAMDRPGDLDAPMTSSPSIAKTRYASTLLYDVGIYLPKFSILAFYYHFIPANYGKVRMALHGVTFFTVLAALITCSADLWWCGTDISGNWEMDLNSCSAVQNIVAFKLNWSLNVITYSLLFFVPFPALAGANINAFKEKVALIFVFSMGIFTVVISGAHFANIFAFPDFIARYRWSTTEYALATITASLPALRQMLHKDAYWKQPEKFEGIPEPALKRPGIPRVRLQTVDLAPSVLPSPAMSPAISDGEKYPKGEWADVDLNLTDDALLEQAELELYGNKPGMELMNDRTGRLKRISSRSLLGPT